MEETEDGGGLSGGRVLLMLAAFIIVVAGMKLGKPLILPILTALFLSVLCIPPMRRLQRWGLPDWAAMIIVLLGAVIVLIAVGAVVGDSIAKFQADLDFYKMRLQSLFTDFFGWVNSLGLPISADELAEKIKPARIMELVGTTAASLFSVVSDALVVVLTVIFMLIEANDFPDKLRAMRRNPQDKLTDFSEAMDNVQKYVSIKSFVSALTGVAATLLTWALGIDFPVLWGLVAFLFNFVPNIGSAIAAVPAVLLALIQHGPGTALAATVGYVVINMVAGNVIEPKMMGERLGLSTLVVFLSLVFWGWVWGSLGMLLSVPLTVILKIILSHTKDGYPVAVLLGPGVNFDKQKSSS